MNDQENQYNPPQPGQAINPGSPQPMPQQQQAPIQQQQQPMQPQMPVPQPRIPQQPPMQPQQPAPVPQPPQQPVYQQPIQQQPQQFQQPAYQQPQQMAAPPRNGPNLKILAAIAGGFIALALIVTVIGSSLGGSSLALEQVDAPDLDFSVSVPAGWTPNTIDITSIDSVSATPPDASQEDQTSVNITRTLGLSEGALQRFTEQTESAIANLSDESYQGLFNISISNLVSDSYGTEEFPAYLVSYDFTDSQTGTNYSAKTYYIYESSNSAVNATFIYSENYADLGDSTDDILATYSPRESTQTNSEE